MRVYRSGPPQELTLCALQMSALEARAAFDAAPALVGQFCAITLSIMSATRKASPAAPARVDFDDKRAVDQLHAPRHVSLLPEPRDGQVRPQNQLRCEKLKLLHCHSPSTPPIPPRRPDPHAGNLDRPLPLITVRLRLQRVVWTRPYSSSNVKPCTRSNVASVRLAGHAQAM